MTATLTRLTSSAAALRNARPVDSSCRTVRWMRRVICSEMDPITVTTLVLVEKSISSIYQVAAAAPAVCRGDKSNEAPTGIHLDRVDGGRDRKSTRLNSSH